MNYFKEVGQNLLNGLGTGQNPLTAFIPNKYVRFGLNMMGGNLPGMGGSFGSSPLDNGLGSANSGLFQTPIQNPQAYLDLFNNPQNKYIPKLLNGLDL